MHPRAIIQWEVQPCWCSLRSRVFVQLLSAAESTGTAACCTRLPLARRDDLGVLLNPGDQCALAAPTSAEATGAVEQEVLHLPTLNECRELAGLQAGHTAREATQGHHRLVRRQNDGIGSLCTEY